MSYINEGYQKVLGFEVARSGGYSCWGGGEPSVHYTALALRIYAAMKRVRYVDQAVIDRILDWLPGRQNPDGSFNESGYCHGNQLERVIVTADVLMSYAELGYDGPSLSAAANYLKANVLTSDPDSYALGYAAAALLLADSSDAHGLDLLSELQNRKTVAGDKHYWTHDNAYSLNYTWGVAKNVELTGIIALAYIRSGLYYDTVEKAVNYLVETRDGYGSWFTTYSSMWAIRALTEAYGLSSPGDVDSTIVVNVNGADVLSELIPAGTGDILRTFDVSEYVVTGNNTVVVTRDGTTRPVAQVTSTWYDPWEADIDYGGVTIDLDFADTTVTLGCSTFCSVTVANVDDMTNGMVVAEIGLPAGFTVDSSSVDALVTAGTVDRWEMNDSHLVVYVEEIPAGVEVEFDFAITATMPSRALCRETRVYMYYNPESAKTIRPVQFEVLAE